MFLLPCKRDMCIFSNCISRHSTILLDLDRHNALDGTSQRIVKGLIDSLVSINKYGPLTKQDLEKKISIDLIVTVLDDFLKEFSAHSFWDGGVKRYDFIYWVNSYLRPHRYNLWGCPWDESNDIHSVLVLPVTKNISSKFVEALLEILREESFNPNEEIIHVTSKYYFRMRNREIAFREGIIPVSAVETVD